MKASNALALVQYLRLREASSTEIANRFGIHRRTALRWIGWLRRHVRPYCWIESRNPDTGEIRIGLLGNQVDVHWWLP